jgi:hypothetical protein
MADDKSSKSDGISTSVSLAISILALLISGGGLYWQFLRGPRVRAYEPNVVYVGKTQIGIPVAFTNEGTASDVVTSGSLGLTPRPPGLDHEIALRWVSPFEEKESYDPNAKTESQKYEKEKVDYVLFSHLPIKAGDTDTEIFWFDAGASLGLEQKSYRACVRFGTARGGIVPAATKAAPKNCSFSVDIDLTRSDLGLLDKPIGDPAKQDDLTVPVNP